MLLPIVILLGAGTYLSVSRRKKPAGMTAERRIIFDGLVNTEAQPPEHLQQMAAVFRGEGLEPQARLLEKRAAIRQLPPEKKKVYKDIFRQAMRSTDAQAILETADAFEGEGFTGNAKTLRKYASGLAAAASAAERSGATWTSPPPPPSSAPAPSRAPEVPEPHAPSASTLTPIEMQTRAAAIFVKGPPLAPEDEALLIDAADMAEKLMGAETAEKIRAATATLKSGKRPAMPGS